MKLWTLLHYTTRVAVTAGSVLAVNGCAHLKLGTYESFDDWYVGREHSFEPDAIGVEALEGSFTGYLVNDLLLRTPFYVVYEGARTAVIPVAVPYYAGAHVLREEDH